MSPEASLLFPVFMEDEPVHTTEHPECSDPDCICHDLEAAARTEVESCI